MAKKASTPTATLALVAPEKLLPSEDNRPLDKGSPAYLGLKESIRTENVRIPVVAVPVDRKPGFFRLKAGHRRTAAAQDCNAEAEAKHEARPCDTIPVLVVGAEWGTAVQAVADLHHRPMTTGERIRLYENLEKKEGWTHARIAAAVGESRSTVSNVLGVRERLCPEIRALLDTHDALPLNALLKVGGLPKEAQVKAWDERGGLPKAEGAHRRDGAAAAPTPEPRARKGTAVLTVTIRAGSTANPADGEIETSVRTQTGGVKGVSEDKPVTWSQPVNGKRGGTWTVAGWTITARKN